MSFAMGAGGRPAAEMNVAPLIDVLLVLFIIFMIISPIDPHGQYLRSPSTGNQSRGLISKHVCWRQDSRSRRLVHQGRFELGI